MVELTGSYLTMEFQKSLHRGLDDCVDRHVESVGSFIKHVVVMVGYRPYKTHGEITIVIILSHIPPKKRLELIQHQAMDSRRLDILQKKRGH